MVTQIHGAIPSAEMVYSWKLAPQALDIRGDLVCHPGNGWFYGYSCGYDDSNGSFGYGMIFRINTSGEIEPLVHFTNNLSQNKGALSSLISGVTLTLDEDGNFYGLTYLGGRFDSGTVFKMTPSGELTTLLEFTGKGTSSNGGKPQGRLTIGPDGLLYGFTEEGGDYGFGTFFKITKNGELTTIVHFASNDVKKLYVGELTLSEDGNFYGIKAYGGSLSLGEIFKLSPAGEVSTLVSFTGTTGNFKGTLPVGRMILGGDGCFYGVTKEGGTSNLGSIFKFQTTGVFSTLAEFSGNLSRNNGQAPSGSLVLCEDGNFYGMTKEGGGGLHGSVFRVTASGGLTEIVTFELALDPQRKGSNPVGSLCLGLDGNLYGRTRSGSITNTGTFFRVAPSGETTKVKDFIAHSHREPVGKLTLGSDGIFYGMTYAGGRYDRGAVFRVTTDGQMTILKEFNYYGSNIQSEAVGQLISGGDGYFYGVTRDGGESDNGTIFKITPGGTLSTLVDFSSDMLVDGPTGGLTLGLDGQFYGMAGGGEFGYGTIFKVTREGNLTRLVDFTGDTGASKGKYPVGQLTLNSDGDFFGLTRTHSIYAGGGTAFKMTPLGEFTSVLDFTGDGSTRLGGTPMDSLTLASDGTFYGTTSEGGKFNKGTLFKMTEEGKATVLVDFTGNGAVNKGNKPFGSLTLGLDGYYYGTTSLGGEFDLGTVFRMSPDGRLVTLFEFTGVGSDVTSGFYPKEGGFSPDNQGRLYGLTSIGGAGGGGTIFRLNVVSAPKIFVSGQGVGIKNGSNTPDLANQTDFGDVLENHHSKTNTFSLGNSGGKMLNLEGVPFIEITGEGASDFIITKSPPTAIKAGDNTTFSITFDPSAPGLRSAVLTIASDDPEDGIYSFVIQGTGIAPIPETKKPKIKLISPKVNDFITRKPFQITGLAVDNLEINRVEIAFNDEPVILAALERSAESTEVQFTALVVPSPGKNNLKVTAFDQADNSVTLSRSFNFEQRYLLTLTRSVPANMELTPEKAGLIQFSAAPNKAASGLTKAAAIQTSDIQPGASVKLTALAKKGYLFSHWQGLPEGTEVIGNIALFTMPAADVPAATAVFIENPLLDTYGTKSIVFQGLIKPVAETTESNATVGLISFSLLPVNGSLSGKILLDGRSVAFTAIVQGDGSVFFKSGKVYTPSLSVMDRQMTLNWSESGIAIVLVGQENMRSEGLAMSLKAASADLLNVKNNQGYYTLVLQSKPQDSGRALSSYPQGAGFSTVTLKRNGVLNLAGMLADGTKIVASTFLVNGNISFVFIQLPNPGSKVKDASVAGTLIFNPEMEIGFVTSTDMRWYRSSVIEEKNPSTQIYTTGWPEGIDLDVFGAHYTDKVTLQDSLELGEVNPEGNACLTFEFGKIQDYVEVRLNVDANKVLKLDSKDKSFTLKCNTKKGLLKGTFAPNWENPARKQPGFQGVLIQIGVSKGGYGYSLSNAQDDTDPESSLFLFSAP